MGSKKDKSDIPPAPGDLQIIQAFLNTADFRMGTDELESPQALAQWLARHGLLAPDAELAAVHFEKGLAVRESLRAGLAGGADSDRHLAVLDQVMAAAVVRGRFAGGAVVRYEPVLEGFDGVLARLLAIVTAAQVDGHWPRFKICASPLCRSGFYDGSPTRLREFCRRRCGNTLAARASRRKKARPK